MRSERGETTWALALAISLGSIFVFSSCSKLGSQELQNGNLGVRFQIVAGNKQVTSANEMYLSPLKVKLYDPLKDGPVAGAPVSFKEITTTNADIIDPETTTDENGVATTRVRAPDEYGQAIKIVATLENTNTSMEFDLSTKDTGLGTQFDLNTTHNLVETAGQKFAFIISVLDEKGNLVPQYTGTHTLLWSSLATPSWGGVLPSLPSGQITCEFNAGVCQTDPIYYLTDTRTPAKFWVGDGPSGLIDVFAKEVSAVPNVKASLVMMDHPGGPLGLDGVAGDPTDPTSDDGNALLFLPTNYYDPVNGTGYAKNYTFPEEGAMVAGGVSTTSVPPGTSYTAYAGVADAWGNYLGDADSGVSWSFINEVDSTGAASTTALTPYLTSSGATATFTPTKTGSGILQVSEAGMAPYKYQVSVAPNLPHHFFVNTEHNNVEQAGQRFGFSIQLHDYYENDVYINQVLPITFSVAGATSGPPVSSGCPRFFLTTDDEFRLLVGQSYNCDTWVHNQTFLNGVASNEVNALLNDATSVSPVFTITTPSFGYLGAGVLGGAVSYTIPALSGSTPVVTVNQGPADHIELQKTSGGTAGDFACPYGKIIDPTDNGECIWSTSGDPASTYYATLTDRGGNFISNPTVTFSPQNYWIGEWSPTSGTNVSTFTPVTAGVWTEVDVTDGTTTTKITGSTGTSPLDHYDITVNDGLSPINSLDARRTHTLTITAKDHLGNTIYLNGNISMMVTYSGTNGAYPQYNGLTPSPAGHNPILPPSNAAYQTLSFTNGQASLTGMWVPNAYDVLSIQVIDSNAPVNAGSSMTPGGISSAVLSPILKTGPIANLKIRTAAHDGGSDLTNQLVTVTTDQAPTYFLNTYDSELNFVNDFSQGDWTGSTLSSYGSLGASPSSAASVTFSPTNPGTAPLPGTGALKVTYAGITVQTSTFTVNPGALDHFDIVTQNGQNETAGHPFTATISMKDAKQNLIANWNSPLNLNIAVLNSSATKDGYNFSSPGNGSYSFSGGIITPAPSFTLYNATTTPTIQVSTQAAPVKVGQVIVNVANDVPDHLWLQSTASPSQFIAGNNLIYNLYGLDRWGNTTTGNGATQNVTVQFAGTLLNGRNVISSTMTGASITGGVNGPQVQGALVNGQATVTVTATQTGTLSLSSAGTPALPNVVANIQDNATVLPVPTVASIDWDPTATPQTTYTASTTTPMTAFKARLLDTYGNVIYTDSSKQITLSLTSGTTSLLGTLTETVVSGIAQFIDIKYPKAEAITLTATESSSGSTVSQNITVTPGTADQAITVLPGQTFNPGVTSLAAAVTGTPTAQTAGVPFTVTMYAVDQGFNIVTSYNSVICPDTYDPNVASPCSYSSFSSGVKAFSITNPTAGVHVVTPNSGLPTNNPSAAYTVNTNTPHQIVLVMPGQTFTQGKTPLGSAVAGTPTAQTAGVAFNVKAYATDDWYNVITTDNTTQVTLALNDTNGTNGGTLTLASGAATFTTTYFTSSGTNTITVSNNNSGTYSVNNSTDSNFVVNSKPATQTIVVMPGQTYSAGKATLAAAVTGTPTTQTAGAPFTAQVYAVDPYFNIDPSVSAPAVTLFTSDANDTNPSPVSMVSGTANFNVDNITATTGLYLQAGGIAGIATNNQSTLYNVTYNTATQTIVVLPGQTFSPGKTSLAGAVTGTPTAQTAGSAFTVTTYVTDAYFNQYPDSTTAVSLVLSDTNATPPAGATYASGAATFTVTNVTAASSNMHASTAYATNSTSSNYTVNPNTATQTIVVLPNQTYTPGKSPGVSGGASTTLTVDAPFTVDVRAVDNWYNTVTSQVGAVTLTTSDPTDTEPVTPTNFTSGLATFTVAPVTASVGQTVVATGTGLTNNASSAYDMHVGAGKYLITVLPGQTYHPGQQTAAAAITGTPTTQTAGVTFTANAIATDQYYNQIADNTTTVKLNSTDGSSPQVGPTTLIGGALGMTFDPYTAGNWNLQASYSAGTAYTTLNSTTLPVMHNTITQTLIVLPGQTYSPGHATLAAAVTGTPTTQTAGVAFTGTAHAVDNWFNTGDTTNGATAYNGAISVTMPSDSYAVVPGASTFANGVATFTFTNKTALAAHTITPSSALGTNSSSTAYTVNPNTVTQAIIVLPGQTYDPGGSGVTGSPSAALTTDSPFTIDVRAVDAYFNTVTSHNGAVTITSTDPTDTEPTSPTAFSSGQATFTITPVTAAAGQTVSTTGTGLTNATSSAYNMGIGALAKTVIVLPGQTFNPGQQSLAAAITGTPTVQTAGHSFTLTAKETDAHYNVINTDSTTSLTLSSADTNSTLSGPQTVASGSTTFTATHDTAGAHTINTNGTGATASSTYDVAHDTVTQTIIVLPGQTLNPGAGSLAAAITGTPASVAAGNPYTVTADAVDAYFNVADNQFAATPYTGAVTVTDSDGSATGTGSASFANGTTAFTITNKTAGSGTTVTPSSALATNNVSAGYTVQPAPATHFTVTGYPGSVTAGSSNNFTVTALDTYGNVATGYTGTVTFTSSDVKAGLPTNYTFTSGSGLDNGVHVFSTTLKTTGTQSITATDTVTPSITGTQSPITVNPGAASKLVFTTQPSTTGTAGANLSTQPGVSVEDAYGNVVTSDSSSITLVADTDNTCTTGGGGTFSATTNPLAASSGVATFAGVNYTKAETIYLKATDGALTSACSTGIAISPTTASKLAFTAQPVNTSAGSTMANVVVTLQDTYGNTITTDSTHTVTVALSSNSFASGTLTQTFASGVATFNNLVIDTVTTGYTLSTTNNAAVTDATSNAFNITPAAASKLAFTTQPVNTAAGSTMANVVVTLQDTYGNTITTDSTHTVTVALSSNSFASGTLTQTFASGVATFNNLVIDAATTGYTLSTTNNAAVTDATSSAFNITPLAANKLAFTTQPVNTAAGSTMANVVVTLEDTYGNTITSDSTHTVTVALSSNAFASGTLTQTFASGVATFNNLVIDAATTGYTLSTTNNAAVTDATSSAFNITPAAASKLIFTTQPSATGTAGANLLTQPVVSEEDAYGNVVTSAADSITLEADSNNTCTTATGTAIGATTNPFTASSGVASFAGVNYTKTATIYLKASFGALTPGCSSAVAISPAAASKLAFTTQPVNTAAGSTMANVVVTLQDTYGNTITSDSTHTVTVALSSNSFASGTLTQTFASGVATFNNLVIDTATTGYTLSTTNNAAVTDATSSAFNITAAAANKLAFTTQPVNTAAGSTMANVVVTLQDTYGNTVTSDSTHTVTVALSSNSFASGTTTQTFVSGVATFNNLVIDAATTGYTLSTTNNAAVTDATSNAFNITPAAANKLAFTTQPVNTAAGSNMANVVVTLQDTYGNTITTDSTHTVTVALSSNAFASGTTTQTFVSGVATFNNLVIDTATTGYTLSTTNNATVTDATSNAFNITPLAASKLAFTTQPVNTAAGSTMANVVVTLQDTYGNTVTSDSTHTVTVALSSNAFASGTTTQTFASGVATFNNLVIDTTTTGYTLSTTNNAAVTDATSNAFNITAAAANKLAFTTQPVNTAAGSTMANVVVTLQDTYGNTITTDSTHTVTVALSSNAFASGTTTQTFASGVATFNNLVIDTATTGYTLSTTNNAAVTDTTSNAFNITSAAANKLAFTTQPANTTAGSTMANVVVTLQDTYGNTITTDSTHTVTVALSSNAFASGTTTQTFASGVATFNNLVIDTTTTGYTLSTTNNAAVTDATSNAFNITSAAANKLAFTTQPANTTAGSTMANVVVTLQDTYGNTVTSDSTHTVTVALSSNAFASGTTTQTFASGVATFSNLVIDAATTGYTLSTTNNATVTDATSNAFNITAAAANKLAFTTQPVNTAAGSTMANVVVTLQDTYGNTITTDSTHTVTVALSSNAFASGTTTQTFASGVATFNNLVIDAATAGYTLSTTNNAAVTDATSNAFNITAAAANKLAFTTQPVNTTAGSTMANVVVTLQDTYGNTITSDSTHTVTVALSSNSFASGTLTQTFASGVATFNNLVIDKATTGYTLSTTNNATVTDATSNAFNITPATASVFVLSGSPTTFAAGSCSQAFTVSTQDAYGNTSTVASPTTANLASSLSGAIYSDIGCQTSATGVSIAAGNSSQTFYFKDTVAESPQITASQTSFTNGTLTVTTNSTDANLGFTVTSYNYGTVAVDTSNTFTLQNTSGSTTSGTLSIGLTSSPMWTLTTDNCSGTTLTPGNSCTVVVTFNAGTGGGSSGTYNAALSVTGNPGGTSSVSLSGTK